FTTEIEAVAWHDEGGVLVDIVMEITDEPAFALYYGRFELVLPSGARMPNEVDIPRDQADVLEYGQTIRNSVYFRPTGPEEGEAVLYYEGVEIDRHPIQVPGT
ncbi:MAG TPA: hypothetical protein VK507_11975, partial [Iamia sp.]|nr:hypothetical protein [Iamia sp.]